MRTKDRPVLLPRGLASVLSQTHQNWRLYLVNDGGDRQAFDAVLDSYRPVFGDRLIEIYHRESRGMENASNAALEHAVEDYVVIHDDDDSWHPDFLSATVEFLDVPENRERVAVTTRCMLVRERVSQNSVSVHSREPWIFVDSIIDFPRMLKGNFIPPICLLFRREVIDCIGPFNGNLPVLGHWDFNLRLMTLGDIDHIPRPLANYHHREAGSGIYGNTVVDQTDLHERHQVMIRNRLLRETLNANPGLMGLLHVIAANGVTTNTPGSLDQMQSRLDRMERTLDACAASVDVLRRRKPWTRAVRHQIARTREQLGRLARSVIGNG
jgi:glycosyltransferase involved in cell wall biosynthesis